MSGWTDDDERRPMRPCFDCGVATNDKEGYCAECRAKYKPKQSEASNE